MTHIDEILKRQMQFAKNGNAGLSFSDTLRQLADEYDKKQAPPANARFEKEERIKKKNARFEKTIGGLAKWGKEKKDTLINDAHAALTAAGWKRGSQSADNKNSTWGNASMPGHQLKIEDEEFTITKGLDVVHPKKHLSEIKSALVPKGSSPITVCRGQV